MEIFLSAVLGELASRSINLLIGRRSRPTALDVGDSLQSALIRAQVIVGEAMGRHIANQAMLQHLDMLRDATHRACYVLDAFRCQSHAEELRTPPAEIISKTPPLLEQLQESLRNLSSMILDARELVVLFRSYPPRLYSQPYSMHLLLGNCMFGFQLETELVINFLLHVEPPHAGSEELDVLPIVGPSKVGKTTLVAHVCRNQRVRDHFSGILLLHDHDLADDDDVSTTSFGQRCATKLQLDMPDSSKDERLLVVVYLVGDLGEAAWNVLYSTCKQRMASGSKIILTSRSDRIVRFGTRPALRLSYVSSEAFWYFFKTITFGSTDPKMHPGLLRLAMDIARMVGRPLIGANVTACLLRENFDVRYWSKVRAFLRGIVQKHVSRFGVHHPAHILEQDRPLQTGRMATPSEDLVFFDENERSSQEEVPEMRFQDVMYGNVKAIGKFKVLGWRSQIPPYYSYVVSCEILGLKTARATKRKRSVRNGTDSFA